MSMESSEWTDRASLSGLYGEGKMNAELFAMYKFRRGIGLAGSSNVDKAKRYCRARTAILVYVHLGRG